jgi:hypothetical protein
LEAAETGYFSESEARTANTGAVGTFSLSDLRQYCSMDNGSVARLWKDSHFKWLSFHFDDMAMLEHWNRNPSSVIIILRSK